MPTWLVVCIRLPRKVFRWLLHRWKPYASLNDLDRKLLRHLPKKAGIFIEAGANDGIVQSNTLFLERQLGWTGILIEPIPHLARQARYNRRSSQVFQVCLVAPERVGQQIEIVDLDLQSFVSHSETREGGRSENVPADVRLTQRTYVSEGVTLSEVISTSGVASIDLLSLDVEGYELEVLKGLDTSRHTPTLILVETDSISLVLQQLPMYSLLETLSHHDYLLRYVGADE